MLNGPKFDIDAVDTNPECLRRTALLWSIYNGRVPTACLLLKCHANVNKSDLHRQTPLMYAVVIRNKSLVESILRENPKLNSKDIHGMTALMHAADQNCKDIIETLIKAGADYKLVSNNGETAFIIACRNRFHDLVRLFISHLGMENIPIEEQRLALSIALDDVELLKILLASGFDANIHMIRSDSSTGKLYCSLPLLWAAANGWDDKVHVLLEGHADPNLLAEELVPAEMRAIEGIKIVTGSAIHQAAYYGHTSTIQLLLDHDASPKLITVKSRETALHWAAERNHVAAVKLLLEYGVRLAVKNVDGKTAYELTSNHEIHALLKDVSSLIADKWVAANKLLRRQQQEIDELTQLVSELRNELNDVMKRVTTLC